jgi:hypothetical protein
MAATMLSTAAGSMSLEVLRTAPRAPQTNVYCERFIGTARRESPRLDHSLNERHLRHVLSGCTTTPNGRIPRSAEDRQTTRADASPSQDTVSGLDGASSATSDSVAYTTTTHSIALRELLRSTTGAIYVFAVA